MKNTFIFFLRIALLFLLGLGSLSVVAQEEEKAFAPELRGAAIMAYSYIPQAIEGGKSIAVIPTWGIDFDYVFRPKWAICLQTDIKVQSFDVEDKDNVILARKYPVSFASVVFYSPFEHWAIFGGPGIEYDKNLSLVIIKLGTEYRYEFSDRFELGVGLIYENRQDLYDGWTFAVSYNTRLWKKKEK